MSAPEIAAAEADLLAAWRDLIGALVAEAVRGQAPAVVPAEPFCRHDLPPAFDLTLPSGVVRGRSGVVHAGPGRTTRQLAACLAEARAGGRVLFVVASRAERDHAARILERLLGDDAGDLLARGGAALIVTYPGAGVLRVVGLGNRDAPPARGWQIVLGHAALDHAPADVAAAWRAAQGRKLTAVPR